MDFFDIPGPCWLCFEEHYMEDCSLYVPPRITHASLREAYRAFGFCPQQCEGYTKDGRYFYFRNRHSVASLTISKQPMEEKEFWDAQFIELHNDDCPERDRGNGVYACLVANRRCRVERNDTDFSYAQIGEETDPEVTFGGWSYDQQGQDQRNSVFAKLWNLVHDRIGE